MQKRHPKPNDSSDTERLARLEARWEQLWEHRQQRRRQIAVVTLSFVLGVGGAMWLVDTMRVQPVVRQRAPDRPQPHVAQDTNDHADPNPANQLADHVDAPSPGTGHSPQTSDSGADSEYPSRVAVAYEAAVHRLQRAKSTRRNDQPPAHVVNEAVDALVADPDVDVQSLLFHLAKWRLSPTDIEMRLLPLVGTRSAEHDIAIAKLLSFVGSDRSVPWLVQACGEPALQSAATAALAAMADPRDLAMAILQSRQPDQAIALIGIYLQRGDLKSTAAYLEFVRRRETRDWALESLRTQSNPPIDALMEFFRSQAPAQRFAAALAVAQIDRADVIERLVELTRAPDQRNAAIAALMVHRSPQAQRFVRLAHQHVPSATALHLARHQMQLALP